MPITPDSTQRPYLLIREALRRGEHLPGDLLTEGTLGESLGLSRTPVREALLRLEQDGLLERTPRGMKVPERTTDQVADLYESTLIIEPAVAGLAALRRRPGDLLRLQALLDEADAAIAAEQDPRELFDRWHEALWDCAGNTVLRDQLERLSIQLISLPSAPVDSAHWRTSQLHHRQITDLVAAHDAEAARAAIAAHMAGARDATLRLLIGHGVA